MFVIPREGNLNSNSGYIDQKSYSGFHVLLYLFIGIIFGVAVTCAFLSPKMEATKSMVKHKANHYIGFIGSEKFIMKAYTKGAAEKYLRSKEPITATIATSGDLLSAKPEDVIDLTKEEPPKDDKQNQLPGAN